MGGIIAGQLGLGYLADRIGRRWGSVCTAATMLVGGVLLACSTGPSVRAMFLVRTCRILSRLVRHPARFVFFSAYEPAILTFCRPAAPGSLCATHRQGIRHRLPECDLCAVISKVRDDFCGGAAAVWQFWVLA